MSRPTLTSFPNLAIHSFKVLIRSFLCDSPVMTLILQGRYVMHCFPCCSARALCSTRNITLGCLETLTFSIWCCQQINLLL